MKNHKTKKYLGQNFLRSHLALRKIIEAGEITPADIILEIGPGKGVLTQQLLASGFQTIAVEKDRELVDFLKNKFAKEIEEKKLILIEGDILDFEFESYKLAPKSYKLIANIPYNITGAILKKFLTKERQPERMVLLVQQEVAQRIVARPRPGKDGASKESVLSISIKAYGTPSLIMKVPAQYFSPRPKVDSAIIKISKISRENFKNSGVDEARFWEIVKAGFAHKRKVLRQNLREVVTAEKLRALGAKRAENITLFEWLELAR